ncbi:MAG: hypothetical protein DRR11_08040 [Gammaproteobacteria bacterium]|nr:MAG: hypothetical protein DRR11_08040 [Gammaproteobacteria bacterium]RLA35312.1 MAG: hypothetical protein DRR15_07775 [Gammaproteobacteria bacterium]
MRKLHITYKVARRIIVTLVGSTVLIIGVIMIITPGPALVFIPLGLAILGLEFAWARAWLRRLRERISAETQKNHGSRAEQHRERYQGH